MIRNFVAGTLWGVVVAGVGLGIVSQVAPPPEPVAILGSEDDAASNPGLLAPDPALVAPAAPEAAAELPNVAKPAKPATAPAPVQNTASIQPAPAELAAAEQAPLVPAPAEPAPVLADAPAPVIADAPMNGDAAALPQTEPPASKPPAVAAAAPPALAAPDPQTSAPATIAVADPATAAVLPADLPALALNDTPPPPADAAPLVALPQPEALLDPAPAIKANPAPARIAPDEPIDGVTPPPVATADEPVDAPIEAVPVKPQPEIATTAPEPLPDAGIGTLKPVAPIEPAPSLIAKDQPSTFAPKGTLAPEVEGVTLNRLPRIGDQATAAEADAVPANLPPVQQFAQSFTNPNAKPLFAIILRDTGDADVDRASLAALPFPVSFAIDPLAPNAAEAAAIYRAAGQEVIWLASGIPVGATASDLEQTFQSLGAVLPQAVAVMDLPLVGFQDDRPLAGLVVPVVKSQGRGLITFNKGLNAADQVARRIDVPRATIFRQLDAEGEDLPLIRRYLDRAAFKAAQEGRVVVLGDTSPVTIAAMMEWTVEGRASSVALAPVTAVLSVD